MRKTPLILVLALFVALLVPASASAYRFSVGKLGGSGTVEVEDLDKAQSSTLRVMNGGIESSRLDNPAGSTSEDFTATVQPGWVVEVYQPGVVGPPGVSPTAKLVVPNVTVAPIAGGTAVTGTGPDGWSIQVERSSSCYPTMEFASSLISGGAWSAALKSPILGQNQFSTTALSPTGDTVSLASNKVPGDAQCVMAMAISGSDSPASTPYAIDVTGRDSAIPTTRIVLRRGGAVLADENDDDVSLPPSAKPLPGDTIDVYRPQGAPTPAYSWTIPPIGSVFDAGANLIAVDAPAASRIVGAPCRPFMCDVEFLIFGEATLNTPAGRTLLKTDSQRAVSGPYDLARAFLPGDLAVAGWVSPDSSKLYFFDSVAGDLVAPRGKFSLARSTNASKLRKSGRLKFKLTSDEAGKVDASLTIAAKKKGKKPIKLGSTKRTVKAGSNKLSLKLSKSGKKSLRAILRSGRSSKATLTLKLTDSAGNVSTVTKSTTLKAKRS